VAIISLGKNSFKRKIRELDTEPPRSPRNHRQLKALFLCSGFYGFSLRVGSFPFFSSAFRVALPRRHISAPFFDDTWICRSGNATRNAELKNGKLPTRKLKRLPGSLWLFLLVACTSPPPKPASPTIDDFGDTVVLGNSPKRVVSLNPATTEIIFAIGAGDRLVGRTHWDLYPAAASKVPDLGSGIRPNVEAVLGARPDLVLLYASVDNRASAARLHAAGIKTLSLKIDHIADFHRAVKLIGRLLGDGVQAATVEDSVQRTLDRVRSATAGLPTPTVFWHIWDAPLITIGRGSYMNELIEIAGGRNVYANMPDVSPTVGIEDVLRRNPQYIITGPEGSTKIQSDPRWAIAPAVKAGRILVADTALVGRPAVRLGEAAIQLATLLHPEIATQLRAGAH
jgi:iron complex transport system substrate-binding protein